MSDEDPPKGFLDARAAARRLGVKPATLYAYVSRGLLRSYASADGRARRYRSAEIEALRARVEARREPSRAAATALDWGAPVLESALTMIERGRLYYRGRDAVALAGTATIEDVAGLLWCDDATVGARLFEDADAPLPAQWKRSLRSFSEGHPVDRMCVLARLASTADPAASERRVERAPQTGARLLRALVEMVAGAMELERGRRRRERGRIAARLRGASPAAARDGADRVLDAALILCADHELNVSAFTARCIASAGATLYDVVTGGLAALRGVHHGGLSGQVEAMLHELASSLSARGPRRADIRRALTERLRRGERLPGFGHPLYPDGDPRFVGLMAQLAAFAPRSRALATIRGVAEVGGELLGDHPTIDFGLAAVSIELGLPPGGAFTLFALGRTVGWIAHAIEQYQDERRIRPRARYRGRAPLAGDGA